MALERFLPLIDIPDVQLISLQKEPHCEQLNALGDRRILDMAPMLEDFADTAALMDRLDLIIRSIALPPTLAAPLAGRPGCCCPTRRTGCGCSIAKIVHGTRRCGCSVRPSGATGTVSSRVSPRSFEHSSVE